MKECSKSVHRRLADANFIRYYFVGNGLDIGGKPDPLILYQELFPLITGIRTWDWDDGDAQLLAGIPDDSFDFVHSSHCLEHLVDPYQGLKNWLRAVRDGGYLVVTVPDEDLYEQGVFPSTYNLDHKWTFTIFKTHSWSTSSINLLDMLRSLAPYAEILKIEQVNTTYRYELPRYDQTLSPIAESAIEFIIRKRSDSEIAGGYVRRGGRDQPSREVRIHLNQYRDDMIQMKGGNNICPPFKNDGDL